MTYSVLCTKKLKLVFNNYLTFKVFQVYKTVVYLQLTNTHTNMEAKLIIGCNYHTTWQSNKAMRFVLSELKDGKARLTTRNTNKSFWTNTTDLIFIETEYNKAKAKSLTATTKTLTFP